MNLILFEPGEIDRPLPRTDPRAEHILKVLRRQPGDRFDAGVVNGRKGKARLEQVGASELRLAFDLYEEPPPLLPVMLLAGLPRPQTARKILQEATSLGVMAVHFARTDKSERSYGESRLWSSGEWRQRLVAGAEQAFTTRVPVVEQHESLREALEALGPTIPVVGLDNYEATLPLRDWRPASLPCALAVGAERGWSAGERDLLRSRRVPLTSLGINVLRSETAALCGLAVMLAKLELL